MRLMIGLAALVGLAACAPELPDSAAGVGFSDTPPPPETSIIASPLPPATAVSEETLPGQPVVFSPAPTTPGSVTSARSGSNADLAAETAAALAAAQSNSGVLPVEASPSNPAPSVLDNPSLSDENDFQAVASRQTIQSDADRLAQQRQQYEVVAPTAVPQRPASSDPNVVSYALNTSHPKGTRIYTRSGVNLATKAQRACGKYTSSDLAQVDFLAKGGPDRDRLGVDPDGDGYACGWDPTPFRNAVSN